MSLNHAAVTAGETTLARRVEDGEFHPQVYLYPTPRMYRPLAGFSLEEAEFASEVNVYVHVPFCRHICSYCGYLKTIDQETLRGDYVDAIVREISLYGELLRHRTVRTLHFGGGTPSLLPPRDLEKIMKALVGVNPRILDTSQEVSIEGTPESVEVSKFRDYRGLGINRVSLGIQSFNSAEISLSKRGNLPGHSLRALQILRDIGVPNIVIDLMIGIEGQSVESFEGSVRGALDVRPETVQLYALGLMPQSGLGRRNPATLMTSLQIYECYAIGGSLLRGGGYCQDCHDRYVIPGKGSFLQGDFILQGKSVIGLGAGARSYGRNVHYRNSYDSSNGRRAVEAYMKKIHQGGHAVESGIYLDEDERIRQYAIGHIERLDKADFFRRWGVMFEDRFQAVYREMIEGGLACEEGPLLKLTSRGILYRDLIAKELFSEKVQAAEEAYRPKRRQ